MLLGLLFLKAGVFEGEALKDEIYKASAFNAEAFNAEASKAEAFQGCDFQGRGSWSWVQLDLGLSKAWPVKMRLAKPLKAETCQAEILIAIGWGRKTSGRIREQTSQT